MRAATVTLPLLAALSAGALHGQSLHLERGEKGAEASIGWSVGPSSNGVETHLGVSLGGRLDLGLAAGRYTLAFDDGSESTYDEYAPFLRLFPFKQAEGGPPVSLAAGAQLFIGDYAGDDRGGYLQVGSAVYRSLRLSEGFALHPYGGFAFVAESYTFGGGPTERARYLTRELGVHLTSDPRRPWIVRLTLGEQAFRRETYRGARAAVVVRL